LLETACGLESPTGIVVAQGSGVVGEEGTFEDVGSAMHKRMERTGVAEERLSSARVIKFGGTSVTGADRVDTIADVVRDRVAACRPILVVSAFAEVTAILERAAIAARDGDWSQDFTRLTGIHADAVQGMTDPDPTIQSTVEALLRECERLLSGIATERTCSPERLDDVLSFGERLSSMIVTAGLVQRGIPAVRVDAADVIVTDVNHGDARADLEATRLRIGDTLPGSPAVPVVTGFIGATPAGVRTTLGREGSDYTAAVLAWCLRAEGVEIWTDVDGVMTADPQVVADARSLRHMSYDELFELASWGAKVVHPKTVRPLRELDITLTIRNTISPSDPGTRVGPAGPNVTRPDPLGVTRLDVQALIAPGHGEPSTEESRHELEGLLRELDEIDDDASVVTVVGRRDSGVGHDATFIADLVRAEGIVVYGVAEAASGRAVSLGVGRGDADFAVRTIHHALLSRVPTDAFHA
jgi:aspartate kinase